MRVACDNGSLSFLPVAGLTVAEVHGKLTALLREVGLPAPLHGGAERAARASPLRRRPPAARVGRRRGEAAARRVPVRRPRVQPVPCAVPRQVFAEPLVLGQLRPRGDALLGPQRAGHPGGIPSLPDAVTREAYSHEVISAGFWPAATGSTRPRSMPTPTRPRWRCRSSRVAPDGAFWHRDLREFLLPYAEVQGAADPDAQLQRFLHSTFDAAGVCSTGRPAW
jgi:hypothetical protein